MDYTLIRSKRKTVAIRILPGGRIEVRAPLRIPKKDIEYFLSQKSEWIAEKKAAAPPPPPALYEGSCLPFLGNFYSIHLNTECPHGLFDGKLFLPLPPQSDEAAIQKAAERFFRMQAQMLFPSLVSFYAQKLGVSCKAVHITGAKTRWGSCSSKATINFSWRLLAAPLDQVELVVVHELCHLKHFNHTNEFYHTLSGVFPDWKERVQKLQQYRQLCW